MNCQRWLEIVASGLLMLSKFFLAISSVFGWWLSILGYALVTILNIKLKLKIVAVTVMMLSLLSVYGLYKWSYKIVGLQPIDFAIITLGVISALVLIVIEAKQKKPLWILQSIVTIAFCSAFILLAMKIGVGWYALLIGHINNAYLYHKKQAYIVESMQIISVIIVLFKLIV